MVEWVERALHCLRRGEDSALVTILAVEGSAPRDAGTRMLVTRQDCAGTIGGGNLEFQVLRQARAALDHPPGNWRIQDYPLGPLLAQCCGGRVRLLIEHLDPAASAWIKALADPASQWLETRLAPDRLERRVLTTAEPTALSARGPLPGAGDRLVEAIGAALTPLCLFGAGHVGRAIARLMTGLPFALQWYDTRSDYGAVAGVTFAEPAELAAQAQAADGFLLILTHDHALDYRLAAAALGGPAAFIGMIGSASKRARFLNRLGKDGFDEAARQRLCCPIGLPGLRGKAPEVIAVSVVAQLLLLSNAPKENSVSDHS